MANSSMSLEALKAHLFETLEGVKNNNDPNADPQEKVSTQDAKCIVNIANSIIEIYKTQVDAVRIFANPLAVGLVCGTYSSVCITGTLWYGFKTRFGKQAK